MSGTKAVLVNRLARELQIPLIAFRPSHSNHRLLTIDMGIRNLALCNLSLRHNSPPEIISWKRIAVSEKPPPESVEKESFEPLHFAPKALEVIMSALAECDPETILIERQRSRSGGAPIVQEWTLRVNMLEAMFHAILFTLQQRLSLDWTVYSVSPKQTAMYWLRGWSDKKTSERVKSEKIRIAAGLLERKEVIVTGEAADLANGFKGARAGNKWDDLADSMLQGVGWWRWHNNRRTVLQEVMGSGDITESLEMMRLPEEATRQEKAREREREKAAITTGLKTLALK
jgi:cruciform cutting endonuclease 1